MAVIKATVGPTGASHARAVRRLPINHVSIMVISPTPTPTAQAETRSARTRERWADNGARLLGREGLEHWREHQDRADDTQRERDPEPTSEIHLLVAHDRPQHRPGE